MNCECRVCRMACELRPGLFAFGEADRAAAAHGVTLAEFFDKYLAVDYCTVSYPLEHILMLAPSTTNAAPGDVRNGGDAGICVFYQNGKCAIQETKPAECRSFDHNSNTQSIGKYRHGIVKTWQTAEAQRQIFELMQRQ